MTLPWNHRAQREWMAEADSAQEPSAGPTGRRMRLPVLAACALAVAVLGIGAFWPLLPPVVATVRPHRGQAVEMVYATGFVEPVQPVAVAARVTAPVTAVLVDEGDEVRRGQPLLRLDDSDLRGLYAQAHAQSVGATLTERRVVTLFAQGWTTRANRDVAVANGEAARAGERVAAAKLGQNVVRSAISGIVIKRDIQPGELAVPTRTLMLLGDPRRSRITATVDERDVPRVGLGQRALVASDAWPGRVFRAHVTELTPTGDPEQRAFRARLVLDDHVMLPLGMSLEINIVSRDARNALLVPNSALLDEKVWTIVDGRVRIRPVHIDLPGQQATAVSGIDDRTVLIAAPSADLREGERVAAARK